MGGMWILFIPFLILIYTDSEKKIKRLNKRIRRLEKQVKGNQDMSRLLEERPNGHCYSRWWWI